MKGLYRRLLDHYRYKQLINFLKRTYFIGSKIPLYNVVLLFIQQLRKDAIQEKAGAVAFNFTLAIFPGIIFLFTLLPYVPIPDLSLHIMKFLKEVMPESIYVVAASTIEDIISKPRGGLLSFGFIFSLFLATNGMMALMQAFNKCYKTSEKRGFIKIRLVATLLTFLLAFILFLSIAFLILGKVLIGSLLHDLLPGLVYYLIILLKYVVIILVFFFAISLIYYFAPAVATRWRFFSVGSFIATLLSIVISWVFSFYINNFAAYNKLYGSIGALIGLMLWLFVISMVLLIGFEINASIDAAKRDVEKSVGSNQLTLGD
ncbi:MAG: YihY/virulence factor BrkB family protein [Cytophagales bacterium]|nr:YihY/virulence factor BrkB family protein [Cytophagales bacterium]